VGTQCTSAGPGHGGAFGEKDGTAATQHTCAPKCASTKHRAWHPRTPRQADAQHACQSCWRWTYLRFEVRDRAGLRYKQLQVCNAVCSVRKSHSHRCELSLHPSTDIQARQLKAVSKGVRLLRHWRSCQARHQPAVKSMEFITGIIQQTAVKMWLAS